MPRIYLSPSTQDFNPFVTGSSEEYYANLIADAMVPYLKASNIDFERNDPAGSVKDSVNASNSSSFDFHLAIHSNAAPEKLSGMIRGSEVYYYRDSKQGLLAADIFANNLKLIYPLPELVKAVPTLSLAELKKTKAPAVLVECAYHDNKSDAEWIVSNINLIAMNLALSTADYLGVPFVKP